MYIAFYLALGRAFKKLGVSGCRIAYALATRVLGEFRHTFAKVTILVHASVTI